jgi:hypothetical protein
MKRVIAGLLWAYAIWYLWSLIAVVVGLPTLVGAVLGLLVGGLVYADPTHRIWRRPTSAAATQQSAAAPKLEPERV